MSRTKIKKPSQSRIFKKVSHAKLAKKKSHYFLVPWRKTRTENNKKSKVKSKNMRFLLIEMFILCSLFQFMISLKYKNAKTLISKKKGEEESTSKKLS